MNVFRNMLYMARRFKTATVLNLAGLAVAFASCFLCLTQVNYDLGYNKSFTEHENLFRMTMNLGPGYEDYGLTLPRPVVERMAAASPHVTGYAVMQGWTNIDQYIVGEQEFTLNLVYRNEYLLGEI